ncbi:MAG: hypothetical protein RLZZ158_822 [Cyanobacteriota bacterium]|jgi:hypothetical protein
MNVLQRLPLGQWLGTHWRHRPFWAVPLLIALGAHGLVLLPPQLSAKRPSPQAQQASDQAELLDISQQLLSENQANQLNSQPLQLPVDTLPLPPPDPNQSIPGAAPPRVSNGAHKNAPLPREGPAPKHVPPWALLEKLWAEAKPVEEAPPEEIADASQGRQLPLAILVSALGTVRDGTQLALPGASLLIRLNGDIATLWRSPAN